MKQLFDEMIAPLSDPHASIPEKAYAQAAFDELNSPGLLKGALYVCNTCCRQLPKLPTATASRTTTSIASLLDSESHPMEAEDVEDDQDDEQPSGNFITYYYTYIFHSVYLYNITTWQMYQIWLTVMMTPMMKKAMLLHAPHPPLRLSARFLLEPWSMAIFAASLLQNCCVSIALN